MIGNVGSLERVIRILLGMAFLVIVYWTGFPGWVAFLTYTVGIVALVTGIVGFCPAWKLFGISTCAAKTSTGT